MKKLKLLLLLFSLLPTLSSTGQNTFNKRLHFDFPAAVLTSVDATDSCFYATGLVADSIPPFKASNIFGKFDLEGNLQIIKTLRDTNKTFEIWKPNLILTPDNNLASLGYSKDSIGKHIWLVKFNTEGDTIFSKYYSDYSNSSWYVEPIDFKVTQDSGFILLNWISDLEPTIFNSDIAVLKTDSMGLIEWHETYGTTQRDEKPRSIISTTNGFLIGAVKDNIFRVYQDFISRTYLLKLDFEGEIEWEHLSTLGEFQDGANDIILNDEDSWIIISRKGTEVPINANASQPRWDNYIYKLNEDQSVEWEINLNDSIPLPSNTNYLSKIIADSDTSYVIAGNVLTFDIESPGHYGNILKITSEGQIIWSRYYRYIESISSRHFLYDIKQTNDGGYIMCGQALDFEQSPQGQQAWLLKVDEYGCLVPGCHLINSTEEKENEVSLLLYPNPTGDYLNFYFDPSTYKEVQFRIVDSAGRIIKTIDSDRVATTYIVPIYDYTPGTYFLQVSSKNGILHSEPFIITR